MPKAPWKQPAVWGAAILVAGLSYYLTRLAPAEIANRRASTTGLRAAFAGGSAPTSDEASLANEAKLSERRSHGETTEQIAKDIKRSLGHQSKVFTPDGRLNDYVLETAGIPSGKREAVQQAFDSAIKAASASLRSRLMPDDAKMAPEKRIHAYRIPADPAEAERLLGEFRQSLVAACGETSAAILLEVYDLDMRFGGFGRYEITVVREPRWMTTSYPDRPDETVQTDDFEFNFVVTEPGTAKQVMRMMASEESGRGRDHFGSLLDPPPWK